MFFHLRQKLFSGLKITPWPPGNTCVRPRVASLLIVVDCSFKQPGVVCKSNRFFTPDDNAASMRGALTMKAAIAQEKQNKKKTHLEHYELRKGNKVAYCGTLTNRMKGELSAWCLIVHFVTITSQTLCRLELLLPPHAGEARAAGRWMPLTLHAERLFSGSPGHE